MSHSSPELPINITSLAEIAHRGIAVPRYDRAALRPRIVHVGVGGFHRAPMALYTEELAGLGSTWGIRGLGLLAGDARMAEALRAQDHLYSLTEKGANAAPPRIIGSIIDFALAAGEAALACSTIADPDVTILSLTITEAGYAEPVDGRPTTFDLLASCLDARRCAGSGPITVLSCDNLPGNGTVTRRAMLAAAARLSSALADWVAQQCSFPNSMVDRITPMTTPADATALRTMYGVLDRWPVVAEPFRQWVIEDDFVAGRPAWEEVGALLTPDVDKWELYKLRMLNAGHSCIAYLSALAGITYVDEAVATPEVLEFLAQLLHTEALPTIEEIPGHPREDYISSVIERFGNVGVRDQIARLCVDGSAKFPTFLIPTIVRQLELGGPIERATLALAAWARYLAVVPLLDQAFDANGDVARRHALAALTAPTEFLAFTDVFPESLQRNERFRATFRDAWDQLADGGAIQAMKGTLTGI